MSSKKSATVGYVPGITRSACYKVLWFRLGTFLASCQISYPCSLFPSSSSWSIRTWSFVGSGGVLHNHDSPYIFSCRWLSIVHNSYSFPHIRFQHGSHTPFSGIHPCNGDMSRGLDRNSLNGLWCLFWAMALDNTCIQLWRIYIPL